MEDTNTVKGGEEVEVKGGEEVEVKGGEEVEMEVEGVEDSDHEEILVNGRLVSLKRMLPAKTKISHYCQKFKIPYPNYQSFLVNEASPEKKFFWCLLELEGKRAVGQSRKKKDAEMIAARRMLDGNYLVGNNYCPPEGSVHVPNKGCKPSRKKYQLKQLNKWARAKEAEREELKNLDEENKEADDELQSDEFDLLDSTAKYAFIFFDTERSGGNIDSELIQLAAYSETNKMNHYIVPKGNVCKQAAKYSHQLEWKRNKFWKGNDCHEAVTLLKAAEEFIDFCKQEKVKTGLEVVLVYHGGQDDITLLNALASVNKDQDFLNVICGSVDFQVILSDDMSLPGIGLSLTKRREGSKNISEYLLGDKIVKEIEDNKHDALFDSSILGRVWKGYFEGSFVLAEKIGLYLISSTIMLSRAKEFVRKQEVKRGGKIFRFRVYNGWKQN